MSNQKNNLAICKAIIADTIGVPDEAILWVEDGAGFFLDSEYGRYKTTKVIIFRVVSEYLVVHIGLDSMDHRCFLLSDPNYPKHARKYLKSEVGRLRKRRFRL